MIIVRVPNAKALYPRHTKPEVVRRVFRIGLKVAAVIALLWLGLTLWVDMDGPARTWEVGEGGWTRSALIVYDPDPIYDLDRQLCQAFAEGLAQQGIRSTVATVAAAEEKELAPPDLFVLCANTYNWRPDRSIVHYVESAASLKGASVVALTLGSGSTEAAQRVFEEHIRAVGARIIASRTSWLMRPNDEARLEEDNVAVAIDMTRRWAAELDVPEGSGGPTQ